MGTLNDEILRATGGPTVQDGLRAYYLLNGATDGNIMDMEREYLLGAIALPALPATNQDLWGQLFIDEGFPNGTYNDQALQFWTAK